MQKTVASRNAARLHCNWQLLEADGRPAAFRDVAIPGFLPATKSISFLMNGNIRAENRGLNKPNEWH